MKSWASLGRSKEAIAQGAQALPIARKSGVADFNLKTASIQVKLQRKVLGHLGTSERCY